MKIGKKIRAILNEIYKTVCEVPAEKITIEERPNGNSYCIRTFLNNALGDNSIAVFAPDGRMITIFKDQKAY